MSECAWLSDSLVGSGAQGQRLTQGPGFLSPTRQAQSLESQPQPVSAPLMELPPRSDCSLWEPQQTLAWFLDRCHGNSVGSWLLP